MGWAWVIALASVAQVASLMGWHLNRDVHPATEQTPAETWGRAFEAGAVPLQRPPRESAPPTQEGQEGRGVGAVSQGSHGAPGRAWTLAAAHLRCRREMVCDHSLEILSGACTLRQWSRKCVGFRGHLCPLASTFTWVKQAHVVTVTSDVSVGRCFWLWIYCFQNRSNFPIQASTCSAPLASTSGCRVNWRRKPGD